jgi:hypothetical protein
MLALSTPLLIIGGIAAAIIGSILVFFLVRSMKGKLEVSLPVNTVMGGTPLSGSVTLTTKKPLDLRRLSVALIGYEVIERIKSDGKRDTDRNEIFRNETNLLEAQNLPAAHVQTFSFSLETPGANTPAPQASPDELAGKIASAIGTVAKTLGSLGAFNSRSRRLEWKVEARADLPGVDLASSKRVHVNVM